MPPSGSFALRSPSLIGISDRHTRVARSESYDKDSEVVALEATALLDSLKDALYVRCPTISDQLPPAVPCPARARSSDATEAATLPLPAVSHDGAERPSVPAGRLANCTTLWIVPKMTARHYLGVEAYFVLHAPTTSKPSCRELAYICSKVKPSGF